MGWVSNLIPASRPWTSALWGALTDPQRGRERSKPQTRSRKGLCFWKQVAWAVHGLFAMLQAGTSTRKSVDGMPVQVDPHQCPQEVRMPSLSKVFKFEESLPMCELWTDACPTGIGGYLAFGTHPAGFFMHALTPKDAQWIGSNCQIGDPAWQTEFEMFAVLSALRFFACFLLGGMYRVFLRSDNAATLLAALSFTSKSPYLTRLAGELILELEFLELPPLEGRHVRGLLNTIADSLSRGEIPSDFARCSAAHFD